MNVGHSDYLNCVYNPQSLKQVVAEAAEVVQQLNAQHQIDAIAFRGSSGAALAFPLSAAVNIPPLYVRKPGEKSHGRMLEGPEEVARYIIVDDFIVSGETISSVLRAVWDAECVGIILYSEAVDRTSFEGVPVHCLPCH